MKRLYEVERRSLNVENLLTRLMCYVDRAADELEKDKIDINEARAVLNRVQIEGRTALQEM